MKIKRDVEVKYVDALETFCDYILKRHGSIIVSVWLIRPPEKFTEKDLYVIVLINDIKSSKATFRKLESDIRKTERAISRNLNIRIHSGFYDLSTYFESVMTGNEKIFEEIGHSLPIYDPTGFFGPIKKLVESGKIVGTQESLFKLIFNIKEHFKDIDDIKIRVVGNIYSAVVDAGQAVLISMGLQFPIHKDVAKLLQRLIVKKHRLEQRYVDYCKEIIDFQKGIEHKKIKTITGKYIDNLTRKGNLFVNRMKDLVEEIERSKG